MGFLQEFLDGVEFKYGDFALFAGQGVLSLQLSVTHYWLYARTSDWVLEAQVSFSFKKTARKQRLE